MHESYGWGENVLVVAAYGILVTAQSPNSHVPDFGPGNQMLHFLKFFPYMLYYLEHLL